MLKAAMGVKNLLRFIEDNSSELLTSQELADVSLIIDGYNILHELYYLGSASTSYGGDYDLFSKSVEKFCNELKAFRVSLFFVFDGASELDNHKFRTTKTRAQERIHLAGLSSHRKRTKILPCLAFRACIDKLGELGIPYCVCDHEADQQLANLASEWKCPLVSNDSDFLLHDLPGGVISINQLNVKDILERPAMCEKKLYTRIFNVQTLLDIYKIKNISILTLLAVICGNDTFSHEKMEVFRNSLNSKKKKQLRIDVARYLRWLAKFDDLSITVDKIIKFNGGSTKDRERILQTIESYNTTSNHIGAYILSNEVLHDSTHPLHEKLPKLFWTRYRSALISKKLMEILFFRRRVFAVQMEDLSCPSSWLCSAGIRQLTYRILSASNTERIPIVVEYDRTVKKLVKREVHVEGADDDNSMSLSTLYEQSVEQRLCLFYKSLGITDEMVDQGVVTPSSPEKRDNDILTAMLIHWVNHCQPDTSKIYLISILVCIVNLSLIDEHLSRQERVCKQIQRHSHAPTQDQTHELGLELSALHAMAQFQSVVSDGLDLLGLLDIDFNICIHEIFSGRYIYNLAIELSTRIEPALYCEEMLVRGSDYSNLFTSWYRTIKANVFEDSLTVMGNNKIAETTISNAAKKRAKRAKQKMRSVSPVQSDSDVDESLVEQLLDNRFAALSIVK